MTGVLVGGLFGLGGLLLVLGLAPTSTKRRTSRLALLIARAGVVKVSPLGIIGASAVLAVTVGAIALVVTAVPIVGLIAGITAGYLPFGVLKRRARQRDARLRSYWPDVVDGLTSAVRAGMSLPEAIADLGEHGPDLLRPAFAACSAEHHATGSMALALDVLEDRLADPVADRVVAALRIAREVGGSDLGTVLRALSQSIRADARMRDEIAGRQSWTVSAARMAVAAPWFTLALLCLRPEAISAYSTFGGAVVLGVAALMSAIAYRLMLVLGRIPAEPRLVSS